MYERRKGRKERTFFNANILILIGMLIVAYQLFTYAKKVYQDYQVDLQISRYEQEIVDLKDNNEEMKELIEYLQTDSYREKVAKGVANLKNPGEEVIIVKGQNPGDFEQSPSGTADVEIVGEAGNPMRWWNYFFGTR